MEKQCQVKYFLNHFAPLYLDTYNPLAVVRAFELSGIEAEIVLDHNYLPAFLKEQAA